MHRLGIVSDACFEEHDTGPGHPECPARLARVRAALTDSGLADRGRSIPTARAQLKAASHLFARELRRRGVVPQEATQ